MLAHHTSEGGGGGQTFTKYVAAIRKRESLKNEVTGAEQRATILEQLATYLALQPSGVSQLAPSLSILRQEASKARMNVITLKYTSNLTKKENYNSLVIPVYLLLLAVA